MKKTIIAGLMMATFSFSAFAANHEQMMAQMPQADQANVKMMNSSMEQMMPQKMAMMGMRMMMMGMKMYMMGDMMMMHNIGDNAKNQEMMMMGAKMYTMGKDMAGGKDISEMYKEMGHGDMH